ncbi:MAG: hypothetical protein VW378_07440 [bacterium]
MQGAGGASHQRMTVGGRSQAGGAARASAAPQAATTKEQQNATIQDIIRTNLQGKSNKQLLDLLEYSIGGRHHFEDTETLHDQISRQGFSPHRAIEAFPLKDTPRFKPNLMTAICKALDEKRTGTPYMHILSQTTLGLQENGSDHTLDSAAYDQAKTLFRESKTPLINQEEVISHLTGGEINPIDMRDGSTFYGCAEQDTAQDFSQALYDIGIKGGEGGLKYVSQHVEGLELYGVLLTPAQKVRLTTLQ